MQTMATSFVDVSALTTTIKPEVKDVDSHPVVTTHDVPAPLNDSGVAVSMESLVKSHHESVQANDSKSDYIMPSLSTVGVNSNCSIVTESSMSYPMSFLSNTSVKLELLAQHDGKNKFDNTVENSDTHFETQENESGIRNLKIQSIHTGSDIANVLASKSVGLFPDLETELIIQPQPSEAIFPTMLQAMSVKLETLAVSHANNTCDNRSTAPNSDDTDFETGDTKCDVTNLNLQITHTGSEDTDVVRSKILDINPDLNTLLIKQEINDTGASPLHQSLTQPTEDTVSLKQEQWAINDVSNARIIASTSVDRNSDVQTVTIKQESDELVTLPKQQFQTIPVDDTCQTSSLVVKPEAGMSQYQIESSDLNLTIPNLSKDAKGYSAVPGTIPTVSSWKMNASDKSPVKLGYDRKEIPIRPCYVKMKRWDDMDLFSKADALAAHFIQNKSNGNWKGQELSSSKRIVQPISVNSTSKKLSRVYRHHCLQCQKTFVTLCQLDEHNRTHTVNADIPELSYPEQTYQSSDVISNLNLSRQCEHQCLQCEKTFATFYQLEVHQRTHTGNGNDQDLSPMQTYQTSELISELSKEYQHQCLQCEKTFTTLCQLDKHQLTHTDIANGHELLSPEMTRQPNDLNSDLKKLAKEYLNQCVECGKKFKSQSKLNVHYRTHTGEKPYSCLICGKTFAADGNLKRHESTHRDPSAKAIVDLARTQSSALKADMLKRKKKKYYCTECDKSFVSKHTLSVHQRIHTGDTPFSCSICGKQFSQGGNLKRHELTHTGEKTHCCEYCGRYFLHRSYLETHYLTHTGEKPHSCKYCEKVYAQRSQLTKHELTHTTEQVFICDHCGMKFDQRKYLRKHMVVHTGTASLPCDQCGKTFTRQCSLMIHKLVHTDRQYACDVCGKICLQRGNLKRHQLTHTDRKPLCCEYCGRTFILRGNLKNHELTHTVKKRHSAVKRLAKRKKFKH